MLERARDSESARLETVSARESLERKFAKEMEKQN